MKKRKILTLALALALILTMLPATAVATEGTPISCEIQPDGHFETILEPNKFSESGIISLATYSADGKMLDLSWKAVPDLSKGYDGLVMPKMDLDGTYKMFLLDAKTYQPLTNAITGRCVVPKQPREVIFELMRDYAKENGVFQNEQYGASVSIQGYSGEIHYFPNSDNVGIYYVGSDALQTKLFVPALVLKNTGEIDECLFQQTKMSSGARTSAIFSLMPANFDGTVIPSLSEYVGAAPTGLDEIRFKEDCRHSLTQSLVMLDKFLVAEGHSLADLGFVSFVPEDYPSQNIAFNELAHYAKTGSKNANGTYRKERESKDVHYYVEYNPSDRSVTLGCYMTMVTCETKIKIYADMRQPYDVEMKFFRYSGTARSTIDPKIYTSRTPIRFTGSNAGNTDWENECKDWVEIILDNTRALPLTFETVVLDMTYFCDLNDLGFAQYEASKSVQ